MKKGIFSALLAALLAVAFSFGFISCKKSEPTDTEAVEKTQPVDEAAKTEETKEEAKEETK